MKLASVLFIGASAAVAYHLMKVTNAVQQLKVSVKSIKHKSTNLGSSQFEITVTVQNPNNTHLKFERLYAQIKVQNSLVGEINIAGTDDTAIKANDYTDIVVPFTLSHLNAIGVLIQLVTSLINKQPFTTPFDVAGTLYTSGLQLPVASSVRLSDYGISGVVNKKINGATHCTQCFV